MAGQGISDAYEGIRMSTSTSHAQVMWRTKKVEVKEREGEEGRHDGQKTTPSARRGEERRGEA